MKPYKDKGSFGVIESNEINTIPNQKRVGYTDPNYKSGKHWVGCTSSWRSSSGIL